MEIANRSRSKAELLIGNSISSSNKIPRIFMNSDFDYFVQRVTEFIGLNDMRRRGSPNGKK
ncbi:MAG: hypothetical protein WC382_03145 [Methanoregulaceae archaeon]